MAACNIRESKETGGRYATDPAQLVAKGKELAGNYGNCLHWQALEEMNEEELKAWPRSLWCKGNFVYLKIRPLWQER
jgi:hypothetical protein